MTHVHLTMEDNTVLLAGKVSSLLMEIVWKNVLLIRFHMKVQEFVRNVILLVVLALDILKINVFHVKIPTGFLAAALVALLVPSIASLILVFVCSRRNVHQLMVAECVRVLDFAMNAFLTILGSQFAHTRVPCHQL